MKKPIIKKGKKEIKNMEGKLIRYIGAYAIAFNSRRYGVAGCMPTPFQHRRSLAPCYTNVVLDVRIRFYLFAFFLKRECSLCRLPVQCAVG